MKEKMDSTIQKLIELNLLTFEEVKWDSEQELQILLEEIKGDPKTVAWLIKKYSILVFRWKITGRRA